jgi:hypothetical protein
MSSSFYRKKCSDNTLIKYEILCVKIQRPWMRTNSNTCLNESIRNCFGWTKTNIWSQNSPMHAPILPNNTKSMKFFHPKKKT